MSRRPRVAPGGLVYHVLNRSVGRTVLCRQDADFEMFSRLLVEAHERVPTRLLSYCILPNYWHFVAWPRKDGELTAFFRWLTHTHAMRWRVSHRTVGYGHLYQGRFKAFPVQPDSHLLTACRYVERSPLADGLVRRAQDWRWSSLWVRRKGPEELRSILSPWPVERPADWGARINKPLSAEEQAQIELSLARSRPFGEDKWVLRTATRFGMEHTVRPIGRPRKILD